jgi:hypothetical protein
VNTKAVVLITVCAVGALRVEAGQPVDAIGSAGTEG